VRKFSALQKTKWCAEFIKSAEKATVTHNILIPQHISTAVQSHHQARNISAVHESKRAAQ